MSHYITISILAFCGMALKETFDYCFKNINFDIFFYVFYISRKLLYHKVNLLLSLGKLKVTVALRFNHLFCLSLCQNYHETDSGTRQKNLSLNFRNYLSCFPFFRQLGI